MYTVLARAKQLEKGLGLKRINERIGDTGSASPIAGKILGAGSV
jgi:hypothetical protein